MRLSVGQELKQEQRQILSQRMIQAMEILQLPLMELQERIETEMENNPLLELVESASDATSSEDGVSSVNDSGIISFEYESEIKVGETPNHQDDFQIADEYAANYADTIDETPARSQNWLESDEERRNDMIANIASPSETLQEYLIEQLSWFDLETELRDMVERVIYNLDSHGFLRSPVEEVLGRKATPHEITLAHEAVKIIKKLDPTGVGAQDIRECLLLQLTEDMEYYELLKKLISDHLEDLGHNRLPLIARKIGCSIAAIQEALPELRTLNPRPGAEFNTQTAQVVIPDIFVDRDENGNYTIRIEEGNIPRLRISNSYQNLLKQRETDKEIRDYVKQKIGSAQWLIDSIRQRQSTISKVAYEIVAYQKDFLDNGPHAIKPLKMQQIADAIGVHVTTVSRACDDKWMQTPQGLFPLKRFFASSVQTSDGEEEASQDAVRLKLQELIDKEDKTKPLSDEDLTKLLEQEGYKVARRTVVKYRHLMSIPSSRERRTWN